MRKDSNNRESTFLVYLDELGEEKMTRGTACDKVVWWLNDCEWCRKHLTKQTYFTREGAKLTLQRMVMLILTSTRKSMQIEVNSFFRRLQLGMKAISKQGCFEAREKLSYTALKQLVIDVVDFVEKEVDNEEIRMYMGFRPIAVDGSVLDVPPDAMEDFGYQPTVGEPCPQARALAFVDVLNNFILRAQMDSCDKGERVLETELLSGYNIKSTDLFLHDRGFYSYDLAKEINRRGASFIFRVKRNCQKDIDAAELPDQEIFVRDLKLRVVNVTLDNGEVEKLVTNIFEKGFTEEFFKHVYNMRWGIETTYMRLKERLEIENFSSGKKNLILQDFYASVAVYNLTSLASYEAQERLQSEGEAKGLKHPRKPNMNIAFSEMRALLFEALCGTKSFKKGMKEFTEAIMRNPNPVRPGRSYPRKVKHPLAKFSMNGKRCS